MLTVDKPVAVVWDVLADFDMISRWAPNVDHSCLTTESADGVGATRRVQLGRNTLLETVTEWTPEHVLAYSIAGLPPVVRSVTNSWHLGDRGASTDVTLTSTIDTGPRPPQKVVGKVIGRALAKASRQMLDGLDSHVRAQELQEDES